MDVYELSKKLESKGFKVFYTNTIAKNYDKRNFWSGKKENKKALQKKFGLPEDPDKFTLGLVSRLTDQKGLHQMEKRHMIF